MPITDSRLREQFRSILIDYYNAVDEDAVEALFLATRPHKNLTRVQEMLNAICKVFGVNVNLNATRYIRLAGDLLKEGFTPALILEEYLPDSPSRSLRGNYWEHDWRGQRGELPKEVSLRDTIQRAAKGWPDIGKTETRQRGGMLGVDV